MRKLNRKGFTLVELLAVIVILAIVVGIALTTVLPTLKKSRQEAFDLTANTAADYLEKQYQLTLIGETAAVTVPTEEDTAANKAMDADEFKAAGLKPSNYVSGTWYITATGRACVTLVAATNTNVSSTNTTVDGKTEAGEYYDVGTNTGTSDTATSSGCN